MTDNNLTMKRFKNNTNKMTLFFNILRPYNKSGLETTLLSDTSIHSETAEVGTEACTRVRKSEYTLRNWAHNHINRENEREKLLIKFIK